MNKNEVLDKAKGLITNDRCNEYGTPYANFSRIAKMWTILLEKVLGEGKQITPAMVANCMVSVKQTRLIQSEGHEDSWVDIAGYAGCGGEVSSAGKDTNVGLASWGRQVFTGPSDGYISHWGEPATTPDVRVFPYGSHIKEEVKYGK